MGEYDCLDSGLERLEHLLGLMVARFVQFVATEVAVVRVLAGASCKDEIFVVKIEYLG